MQYLLCIVCLSISNCTHLWLRINDPSLRSDLIYIYFCITSLLISIQFKLGSYKSQASKTEISKLIFFSSTLYHQIKTYVNLNQHNKCAIGCFYSLFLLQYTFSHINCTSNHSQVFTTDEQIALFKLTSLVLPQNFFN